MNASDWVDTISTAADHWYDKLTHTGPYAPGQQLPAISTTSGVNMSNNTVLLLGVGLLALVLMRSK